MESVYLIEDKKEFITGSEEYEYKKIYLSLENIYCDLDGFKDYINFIFNDKMDTENLRNFEDVIDKVRETHKEFLCGSGDYRIEKFITKEIPLYKYGVFVKKQDAENKKLRCSSELTNPRIVELKIVD